MKTPNRKEAMVNLEEKVTAAVTRSSRSLLGGRLEQRNRAAH